MATASPVRMSNHISDRGHPLPRRTSPEASLTLQHHRIGRNKSLKLGHGFTGMSRPDSRYSSKGSQHTSHSDAQRWFERSNRTQHPSANQQSMDVDPPFFQRQSTSSNGDSQGFFHDRMPTIPRSAGFLAPTFRPSATHSSSADDYRSVIDDLTIENKRLKEELKKYRNAGADLPKKDRLFEVKVHGLPGRKKRELEATLREFASSVGEGSIQSFSKYKKPSKDHISSLANSKHDSASSSNSQSRPADSAYASMSTDREQRVKSTPGSKNTPYLGRTKSSDQKVQTYLEDIPEGLHPRSTMMADKDKKKWVVRRLEQLFTGKMGERGLCRTQSGPALDTGMAVDAGNAMPAAEPSREAMIADNKSGTKTRSRDLETSESNGDDESGDHSGDASRAASNDRDSNNVSPPTDEPDQRPTRPRDLDPDRVQVPSANMDYIRHLGGVAPDFQADTKFDAHDASMDAQGWIHLNLLCSMAQLHIINVTPSFIRSAVSERSAKFQLSRDGRKIRWRGGTEGTRFSGESSGASSSRSAEDNSDDMVDVATTQHEGRNSRKRQKTAAATTTGKNISDPSVKYQSENGPSKSGSSEHCHYKPLFLHHSSSADTTVEESISPLSYDAAGTSVISGSTSSPRRKRKHDGAIVYYAGAPFCTDLTGDAGDASPRAQITTGDDMEVDSPKMVHELRKSASGSLLSCRPLTESDRYREENSIDLEQEPTLVTDELDMSENGDDELSFHWSAQPDRLVTRPFETTFEACGLGRVVPEDHFAVQVITRHPINVPNTGSQHGLRFKRVTSHDTADTTDSLTGHIAAMSTRSPRMSLSAQGGKYKYNTRSTSTQDQGPRIEFQQVAVRHKALEPVPVPPPAMFIPPFGQSDDESDSSDSDEEESDKDEELPDIDDDGKEDTDEISVPNATQQISPKALNKLPPILHHVAPSQLVTTASGDESDDGDESSSDEDEEHLVTAFGHGVRRVSSIKPTSAANVSRPVLVQRPDSSCATAGGAVSGHSSAGED